MEIPSFEQCKAPYVAKCHLLYIRLHAEPRARDLTGISSTL